MIKQCSQEGGYTCVGSASQHEQSNQDDNHVQNKARDTSDTPFRDKSRAVISLSHPQVCGAPEDEAEKGIKERAHQR